jgi:hypothetical protein
MRSRFFTGLCARVGVAVSTGSDTNAMYRVVVGGELDGRYGCLFEGMQMTCGEGMTVLMGVVRDRAHLYGVIERVEELGLELLSVDRVGASRSESRSETGGE